MNENQTTNEQVEREQRTMKLNFSYHTNTSSKLLRQNIINLKSCSSLMSLSDASEKNPYVLERKLVMKLLHCRSEKKKSQIMRQMQIQYSSSQWQQNQIKIFPVFKHFPLNFSNLNENVLNYFFIIYLKSMGYKTEKNRQYIYGRARLIHSLEHMPKIIKFYETFAAMIEEEKRYALLMRTCLNGWQDFIHCMCSLINN